MTPECPDSYVYLSKGKWWWRCPCGETGGPEKRRMDADKQAEDHQIEVNRARRALHSG